MPVSIKIPETTKVPARSLASKPTIPRSWSPRGDSFKSVRTGLGVQGLDPKESLQYTIDNYDILTFDRLAALYFGSGLGATVIDIPVLDAFANGFDITVTDDTDGSIKDRILAFWKRIDVFNKLKETLTYDRVFGGAASVVCVLDGKSVSQPVDFSRTYDDTVIRWLDPHCSYEMQVTAWNDDLESPDFGKPALYKYQRMFSRRAFNPIAKQWDFNLLSDASAPMFDIHADRVIPLVSNRVHYLIESMYIVDRMPGWGLPAFQRCYRALRELESTWSNLCSVMQRYISVALGIHGLAEMSGDDQGRYLLTRRLDDLHHALTTLNAWIHDPELETLAFETADVRGMADTIDAVALHLAGVTHIPVTKLLGRSPAGQNATGESDDKTYSELVGSLINDVVIPALVKLTTLFCRLVGIDHEKHSITITASNSTSESPLEQAQARNVQANTDAIYMDRNVLTPDEVRQSRFGGKDGYSFEMELTATPDELDPTLDTNEAAIAKSVKEESDKPIDPKESDDA